jgi:GT2 family glycosyltransferase
MPRVVYAHKQDTIQYDGSDNHFLGLMILHNENQPLSALGDETRHIGSIVTACFLVDRTKLGELEPFDESFFIYFEDHDFGVRMRALGREVLSVPAARCFHDEGTEGLSVRQIGKYSKKRVVCLIHNRWQFLLKNYSFKSLLLLSPLFSLYELAQFLVVLKKRWFVEWCKAVYSIVANSRGILTKRRQIQAARTIPDREILLGGPLPFRDELAGSSLEQMGKNVLDQIARRYWRMVKQLV